MRRQRRVCRHSVIARRRCRPSCETLEQADRLQAANRSRSHRRRKLPNPDETAARLSARRDRDGQRHRSGDCFQCFEVALTDIDSTSCETFTYCTVHTSDEPFRRACVL